MDPFFVEKNMFNKTISLTLLLLIFTTKPVSADILVAENSAHIAGSDIKVYDQRTDKLSDFFESMNSPMAPYSEAIIRTSDKYGLDWRLLPAISGVESTFGKRMPVNSYNAYGWANGNYSFDSWEDSFEVVISTLKTKYIDRGANTLSEISRIYAPPSTTWAWKVEYFMNKIDPFPLEYTL